MPSFSDEVTAMSGGDNSAIGRPETTLFMLMSVDGKISSGFSRDRDLEIDLASFEETRRGLQLYYDIEKTTDLWTICTGKTKSKIGINSTSGRIYEVRANIVIIDNLWLTEDGVNNLCRQYNTVVIFTKNKQHPAFVVRSSKLHTHYMPDFTVGKMLNTMWSIYGVKHITVQTGAETNAQFIRDRLIDNLDIVVAPIVVTGSKTPTLIGGDVRDNGPLSELSYPLGLVSCEPIGDGYIRLRYKVINSEK